MSPSAPDSALTSNSIPPSSALSRFTALRVDEPDTTASGTQPGQAAFDSPPAGSQAPLLSRSQRTRTPTERGRQFKDDIQRSHTRSVQIKQAKARKSRCHGAGRGTGNPKRKPPAAQSDDCDPGNDDESADDDCSDASEWIVDDDESSDVVPTSNPGELEEGGYTYQSELENESFRRELTGHLEKLLPGERKKPTRYTLKEALKFIRSGDQAPSVGASQQHPPLRMLPAQELDGGGGHHLDYEPQPGQKRRFVPPPAGGLKRGRLDLSGTPSTVIDNPSPPPIPRPVFTTREDPMHPPGLPLSSAGPGSVSRPPGLPVSAAVPIAAKSWSQPHEPRDASTSQPTRPQSPSPLPENSHAWLDDTQAQPEESQTQPEDTQTQPEDTQTQPEDTQTQPERTQVQLKRSQTQPEHTQPNVSRSRSPSGRSYAPPPNSISFAQSIAFARENVPRAASSFHDAGPSTRPTSSDRAHQLDNLRERFQANARNRARAQAIANNRGSSSRLSTFNYDEPMEDDTEDVAAANNDAEAKPAKRKKSQSGLNCQPGRPRQIATSAIVDVTAYTFARGPYETRYTNLIWGLEAYERCWKEELPQHAIEPARPELVKEIINRVPSGRTVVKGNIRSVIKTRYEFIGLPKTQTDIDNNIKKYNDIHEKFHFGSLERPDSHYEHPALEEAFIEGLFDTAHSPCVVHHKYFNPVPVETVAFVLTMMEACIREWRTGQEVFEHLNSKEQAEMYEIHLNNLGEFAGPAAGRLNRMRQNWYAAAAKKWVRLNPEVKRRVTIRVEDIRADTPPPNGGQATGSGA